MYTLTTDALWLHHHVSRTFKKDLLYSMKNIHETKYLDKPNLPIAATIWHTISDFTTSVCVQYAYTRHVQI